MTPTAVIELGRQAVEVTLMVSAPLFLAALVTGLIISIFQAATQINEMTLTFIPKLLVMFLVLVLLGPWTLRLLVDYVVRLLGSIPGLIG